MAVYHFKLLPLTPIHVGTGGTITPENYFVANKRLTRFDPAAVVRAMAPEDRRKYVALVSGPETNMETALKLLRQHALKTPAAWVYSVELGPDSLTVLSDAIERLDARRGEVRPLLWNEIKRVAILPGSAIKGAIRGALLSAKVADRAKKDANWRGHWQRQLPQLGSFSMRPRQDSGEAAKLSVRLETETFRKGHNEIEWDPFRFVKVSDIEIPQKYIRVDRAGLLGKDGENHAHGIQVHVERIISWSDGGEPVELDLYLTIEKEERRWHPGIVQYLDSVPDKDYLMKCLRWHYFTRVAREATKFSRLYPHKLRELFQVVQKSKDGLIRIGRFSHFEALSVEEYRRTLDRRGIWVSEGTSRTFCAADESTRLPFGWAMVRLVARIQ